MQESSYEIKKLNQKLSMFHSDFLLLNEYQYKSESPPFEQVMNFYQINLELLSLLFQVKINVYYLDNENFINCLIYNNKFFNSVNLYKNNTHYDLVYNQKELKKIQICQSILNSVIYFYIKIINDFLDINYTQNGNIEYQINLDGTQEHDLRQNHKKSFSDCIINQGFQENSQFNMFGQLNLPKNFLQQLENKEQQNQIPQKDMEQTNKKISYYYTEDHISQQPTKPIFFNEQDQSRKTTLNFSNGDSQINKIIEDYEYEELKNNLKFNDNKTRYSDPQLQNNIQINITNNYIECVNNIQNINQNNIHIKKQETNAKQNNFQASISQDKIRYTGYLKFFDEKKNYGFIVKDDDFSDVFVHYDDLQKAIQDKSQLKINKVKGFLRFQFHILNYIGKHSQSRKAIDIQLIHENTTIKNQDQYTRYQ